MKIQAGWYARAMPYPTEVDAGMRGSPFVPTELASPEVHDLADPAVRVRPSVHRRDGRLVAEPQVDGVDAEVVRELVHRRLHGERAHRLTGRPHGGVGDEVELDDRRPERDGRRVVEIAGRADHLVRAAAHRRGPHDRLVDEGRQATVRGGAESDPLGGRRPAAHGPVDSFAGQRHPHGTPGGAGGHDRQQRSRPHEALAAEPAADEGRQHANLLHRHVEPPREVLAEPVDVLCGVPDGEGVAVPDRGRGVRLHRVVVLGRRGEPQVHAVRGSWPGPPARRPCDRSWSASPATG